MNDHECKPVEISVESYIETALTEWYGRRCTEHDDPARFAAWAEYDELLRNVQSADAERKQWDLNYKTYCQTIADLEQRLAAAEAHEQQTHERLGAILGTDTSLEEAAKRMAERLAAAEARVTKLTEQLALRLRAEGCDREELLKECIENRNKLAAAEADAARWRYVRDNATLAGETQDGVYLWEFEALDMNPDSIEADVDASIEAANAGGVS